MARIFISHSSLDGDQASRLLAWLHSQGFVSTFLDFDKHAGIVAGADWERSLYRELSGADAVILILTKNWFDSKWCFVEFAQARALGKAIFPLIETPTGQTLVSSDIQHLNLTLDREGGLERLQAELTRIALNTRGGFPWDQTRPPYPGLLAFDEADAAIYFGRDDEIRRLIERLNARRAQGVEKLVVVLGASGSGKSSLLRAGVLPRLKRDPHNWIVLAPFRPQLDPLAELAQVVATGLGTASDWRQWRTAFDSGDLPTTLADLARDLRARHSQNEAQILLVIDQGEELFSTSDFEKTECFFNVLNALLDDRLPFLAAMSLRSDYLGRLQQEPRLAAAFEQFSLKPMPLERVRDIIEGPAKVAGIAVEEALVATAMADARTEDALPLLAFALRELYDKSARSARLTEEAYRALGDAQAQLSPLENAVRRKADEVLAGAKPAPEDLQALKDAFIPAMVRVNPEGEYVRRPARIADLSQRALPLLERLAKARLLTILDERGVTTVEVTHEALLRKWPLLRGWLDEEREFLIGKDQLEGDLSDWNQAAANQQADALLTGLKLIRARAWLIEKPLQLTLTERDFIQASIAREKRRRVSRMASWAAIGLVIVMSLVAYILVQRRTVALEIRLRGSNLGNFKLVLPADARLVSISPLPAGSGKTPWGSGEPLKLSEIKTGAETFGVRPGYYVVAYEVSGRQYFYGIYSHGYGYDPTIELPAPPNNRPGYRFVPGGTVPTGDLLGIGLDSETSLQSTTLKPYFIAADIVTAAESGSAPGSAQAAYGYTWQEATTHARRSNARLPTRAEWAWAATLGIFSWDNPPRWEWTATRSLPGPYDDEDGRNNPWAVDTTRLVVGGGVTQEAVLNDQYMVAELNELSRVDPTYDKDFAKDGMVDGSKYADDPQYLQRHPQLVAFLRLHPDAHDIIFGVGERKYLLAHPTSVKIEPTGRVHSFRLAAGIETVADKPWTSFTVRFGPDSWDPDVDDLKYLRQFAQWWIERGPRGGEIRLEGNTDEISSAEYDLAVGENLANSIKSVLVKEGVPPHAIYVRSNGKERRLVKSNIDKSLYLFTLDNRVDVIVP